MRPYHQGSYQNRSFQKKPICDNFISGARCRQIPCTLHHPFRPQDHQNVNLCRGYEKGYCPYGMKCLFRHDINLSPLTEEQQEKLQQIKKQTINPVIYNNNDNKSKSKIKSKSKKKTELKKKIKEDKKENEDEDESDSESETETEEDTDNKNDDDDDDNDDDEDDVPQKRTSSKAIKRKATNNKSKSKSKKKIKK